MLTENDKQQAFNNFMDGLVYCAVLLLFGGSAFALGYLSYLCLLAGH